MMNSRIAQRMRNFINLLISWDPISHKRTIGLFRCSPPLLMFGAWDLQLYEGRPPIEDAEESSRKGVQKNSLNFSPNDIVKARRAYELFYPAFYLCMCAYLCCLPCRTTACLLRSARSRN